jgi:hypothetical protein
MIVLQFQCPSQCSFVTTFYILFVMLLGPYLNEVSINVNSGRISSNLSYLKCAYFSDVTPHG